MKANKYLPVELLAILASGILKFIFMDRLQMRAFYIAGICLLWLSYIFYRYTSNKSILKYWGFKREHFRQSFVVLLPVIIISIIITLIYGIYNDTIMLSWHILPVLCLYPIWGVFQQYLILGLIAGNLMNNTVFKLKRLSVVLLTSAIFSLVHYPSIFLMIFVFCMEALFVIVYMKWRNLWALGLAHGWIASFLLYYVMNRDLWSELFVWF